METTTVEVHWKVNKTEASVRNNIVIIHQVFAFSVFDQFSNDIFHSFYERIASMSGV